MSRELPRVLCVGGTTGVGKTQLAVELARRFDGEIVNADSMQVYAALDVLTNKPTAVERAGVPHHLLGHVAPDVSPDPHAASYTSRLRGFPGGCCFPTGKG